MVASVKPLRGAKCQADQLFSRAGKLLDSDKHATFLLSTVTIHNSRFASVSARITRKVCHTELGDNYFEICSPSEVAEDLDHDTDSSATTLLANMNNHGNSDSNSYFPSEDHSLLTSRRK